MTSPTINVPPRMLFALLVLADFGTLTDRPAYAEELAADALRNVAQGRPARDGFAPSTPAPSHFCREITLPGLGELVYAVAFEEAPTTERLVDLYVTAAAPFKGGRVKAAEELFARVASLRAYAPNARPEAVARSSAPSAPAEAPEDPAPGREPPYPGADPDAERLCAVCFASQFHTRGGWNCNNFHGGADAVYAAAPPDPAAPEVRVTRAALPPSALPARVLLRLAGITDHGAQGRIVREFLSDRCTNPGALPPVEDLTALARLVRSSARDGDFARWLGMGSPTTARWSDVDLERALAAAHTSRAALGRALESMDAPEGLVAKLLTEGRGGLLLTARQIDEYEGAYVGPGWSRATENARAAVAFIVRPNVRTLRALAERLGDRWEVLGLARLPDAGTEHLPGGPAPEATTTDHRWHDHTNCDHDGEVRECPICEGGLSLCLTCGAAEGELTTDCPGRKMTGGERYAAFAGGMDYVAGLWVPRAVSRGR